MTTLEDRNKRILTTHTGSLPRPDALSSLLLTRVAGTSENDEVLAREAAAAVEQMILKQIELGLDIVSDGEQSKPSFQGYIADRLSGIVAVTPKPGERRTRENSAFPSFYKNGAHPGTSGARSSCTGPLKYTGHKKLAEDIANLKAALKGRELASAFVSSLSPSSCAHTIANDYYASNEEHLLAVAEAMREEYEGIVAAGFQLQIDDPHLAMHYMLNPDLSVDEVRKWSCHRIEILNHALRNIPPERVRHHTCYGINIGPRTSDFEMKYLADLIITIRAKYLSYEMANPRHDHEWRVWEHVKLPEDKVLMPGCITHTSVLVEHPELVAQRIVRLAKTVRRERVIASTDCGFASTLAAGRPPEIAPEVVWAKFASLVQGARLATWELWGN